MQSLLLTLIFYYNVVQYLFVYKDCGSNPYEGDLFSIVEIVVLKSFLHLNKENWLEYY